ncbi:MAG: cytochrome c oxidase subunit II [Gemmatimonadales bacterium]
MNVLRSALRRPTRLVRVALPVLLLLAFAACTGDSATYPQSTLIPKGDFAEMVDQLFMTTVWWALAVFILVEGVLVFAIWKFRGRPEDAEPAQIHGNTTLEIVWTIIPAAILAFIAVPTVRTIWRTSEVPGRDALVVEVIGHQWWFEFRYPEYGIVTANELRVPLGRTVDLRLTTKDVIHSFWVPQFAGKRDMIARHTNHFWFSAADTGVYSGQCAEFCGLQHARMGFHVVSSDSAGFVAWVAGQKGASPDSAMAGDSVYQAGKSAFLAAGCIGCHAMAGQPTERLVDLQGPNLSHVGSRHHLVAGMLKNTDEELARWLRDPNAVKEGSLMKLPRPLTEGEITALVHYLRAHR